MIASIVQEVNELDAHGLKEIILIAQDTTRYGIDLAGKSRRHQILREVCQIPGWVWLRLLYCYPDYLSDELLFTIKEEEKICKYLDIPLQHISDPILKAMGRTMTKSELYRLLDTVRSIIPEIILLPALKELFSPYLIIDSVDSSWE